MRKFFHSLGNAIRTFVNFARSLKQTRNFQSSTTIPIGGSSDEGDQRNIIDYNDYFTEGYAANSIIFSCIRKIATTAPAASLQVQAQEGTRFIQAEHRLNELFARPNPYDSSFSFQESLQTFLNLAGEVFIYKIKSNSGETQELRFMRPDRMFPVVKQVRELFELSGYVFEDYNGERFPFLPDEIIHIKYPNPGDRVGGLGRGISPLSAGAILGDVDNSSNIFLRDFFRNAAVPFGLLTSKNPLSQAEIGRIRERIKEQYSGAGKFHEIMILDSQADYARLGLSLDEIAFPDIRRVSESRICACFDISPIVINLSAGFERATFNNVLEAKKSLWTDKIVPDNKRISLALTHSLQDELGGLIIGHDYSDVAILQEERTETFNRATAAYDSGWLTKNEARDEAGFQPVANGNHFKEQNDDQTATNNSEEGGGNSDN